MSDLANSKKRELVKEYQQSHRRMGVFQIRNLVNEKVLVLASLNLDGLINRHRFQLKLGGHTNRQLQAEWNELGGDKFAFEVLDELTPQDSVPRDYREELALLEEMWLERLEPYGERGYNERKLSREERLRMIAANRTAERLRAEEAAAATDAADAQP